MPQPFKYHAFISYSHQDSRWGDWLHKTLETYPVPKRLVGRKTAAGTIPKRLAPIFRDRDELPSAHDLGSKVEQALAQSGALIVICSPRSASSRWVSEEISAFKRMGHGDRVFCLIVDGEPNASDMPGREAEECFAPALRYEVDTHGKPTTQRAEPIAADARPGKDGKVGARLKLLSGLLDVGFDELRQRDVQRAHRRMAWVAGLALLGMVVTTSLAVFAMHARDQAQFQREQAETLIGFMLGNLGDKLGEVDRLDILDEVADHVMGYFEAQHQDSETGVGQRAEALLAVGKVRMAQGRFNDAGKAYADSLQTAQQLVIRKPGSGQAQIAVADAYFYLGMNDWTRGDVDAALGHFQKALPIVTKVIAMHPGNEEWRDRLRWSHNNIGHILEAKGRLNEASKDYEAVLEIARTRVSRYPHHLDYQKNYAQAHDAMGQLLYSRGDLAGAEQHYGAERDLMRKIVADNPKDNAAATALATAEFFYARVAGALGNSVDARISLQRALEIGETRLTADASDVDKMGDVSAYCRLLAHHLRTSGNVADTNVLLERSERIASAMLSISPDYPRAKSLSAFAKLERAELAWQAGKFVAAGAGASAAGAIFAELLRQRADDRDSSLGMARAQLMLGKVAKAQGEPQGANAAWNRGLTALAVFGRDSNYPNQLVVKAEILASLTQDKEARKVKERLAGMGYRDPEFIKRMSLELEGD